MSRMDGLFLSPILAALGIIYQGGMKGLGGRDAWSGCLGL